ncbi:phage tail protein [Sungkyunkwania multivorans]|uniref:Phage tail protein n=1 Tax=Sungkyunkwania multivorans TaxID=1173618 RepID=A0ABW3CVK8_9FLAO
MEPFIAQIQLFAGNFAPRGWAFCNGQLMPITQNTALFSLLGTTYGGDGRTNFALPNLQSRAAIHAGHGPGLASRALGSRGGAERNVLNVLQLPSHMHAGAELTSTTNVVIGANEDDGDSNEPAGKVLGIAASGTFYNSSATNQQLAGVTATTNVAGNTAATGGNEPIDNLPPFLALNYIIALEGIYPARS